MSHNLKTFALFIITSFLFIACKDAGNSSATGTDNTTKPAFDLAAARTAIEAVNAEFGAMAGKGDSVGLAGQYATDAKLMGPNMPAFKGRAAIQSAFGGMFSGGPMGLKLTTSDVWGNESYVTEEGVFSMSDKDGKEFDKGKYLVVWKMEDGKWKLFRDCWNSDNPIPSSK